MGRGRDRPWSRHCLGVGRSPLRGTERWPRRRAARTNDLEPPGALRRCGHDSRRGDLDTGDAGEARVRRVAVRAGRIARAAHRPTDAAASNRARHSNRHRGRRDARLPGADRDPAREFRFRRCAQFQDDRARDWRSRVHRTHELLRLVGLRLHGGAHRRVQQSAVRHRNPGGDRSGAAHGGQACVRTCQPPRNLPSSPTPCS